jgi:amino acid transporter
MFRCFEDDSACHVSEETAGAAHAAPYAILIGVAGTAGLGWILMIAASFATTSVADVLATELPLPMGQIFLDALGKRGMLILWGFIIVVQVCDHSCMVQVNFHC